MEATFALSGIPDTLRKHCDPQSPQPLRMMAAKGLAPMPPGDLVKVAYLLMFDTAGPIAAAAKATLAALPDKILLGVIGS